MGTINVAAGGTFTVDSTQTDNPVTLGLAATLNVQRDAGTPIGDNVVVDLGGLTVAGLATLNITNATVKLDTAAAVSGGLAVNVSAHGIFEEGAGVNVRLLSPITLSGGTLVADPGVSLSLLSPIDGWQSGDVIDIQGVPPGLQSTVVWTQNTLLGVPQPGGTLAFQNQSGATQTLTFGDGTYTSANFLLTGDGNGGSQITFAPACYAEGTLIRTSRGDVPIEEIVAGDWLETTGPGAGDLAPVIWTGRRRVDCTRHLHPERVWPVRVAAHAFGDNMPARELLLSPDHAVYADDVLVPIKYLINDHSVRQIQVDRITYYHLELPQHALILAEGMPAESYLDTGDRASFENCGVVAALHPSFSPWLWESLACAPLQATGAAVEALRGPLYRIEGAKADFTWVGPTGRTKRRSETKRPATTPPR